MLYGSVTVLSRIRWYAHGFRFVSPSQDDIQEAQNPRDPVSIARKTIPKLDMATAVSETVPERASSQLPIAMQYVESWTAENDMVLHPTKEILVSFLNNPPALPPVVINGHTVLSKLTRQSYWVFLSQET